MKNIKKTALAAAVLMSLMTGSSVWAATHTGNQDFSTFTDTGTVISISGGDRTLTNKNGSDKTSGIKTIGGDNCESITLNASGELSMGVGLIGKTNTGGVAILTLKANEVNITATTENGDSSAVWLQTNTEDVNTPMDNRNRLHIIADTIKLTGVATGTGSPTSIIAMSNAVVTLEGNTTLEGDVVVRGHSIVEVNKDKTDRSTVLHGMLDFDFDGVSSGSVADATVQVNFAGSESEWVGNAVNYYGRMTETQHNSKEELLKVTGLSVSLVDGATWKPTYVKTEEKKNDSTYEGTRQIAVNNLTMNKGIIDMTTDDTDANTKVMVDNLTAMGSEIKGAEGKNATMALYGENSSLTNTNVTGVEILVANGAKLNVDGGTFTNQGFNVANNCDRNGNPSNSYVVGGSIYFTGSAEGVVKNATFSGSTAPNGYGGAIYSTPTSNVTFENVQFLNNSALEVGAVGLFGQANVDNCLFNGNYATKTADNSDGAGAIFLGAESVVRISGSTFTDNESATRGGAIATRKAPEGDNSAAKLDIIDTTFTDNKAATNGGAIDNHLMHSVNKTDAVYVSGSTFTGNSADKGGAIFNNEKDNAGHTVAMYITKSTFTENKATTSGGAIYAYGTLTLDGVTFKDNSASQIGAVSVREGATAVIENCVFDGNHAEYWGALKTETTTTSISIKDTVFQNNYAKEIGAVGLYKVGTLENVQFINNKATYYEGDEYWENGAPKDAKFFGGNIDGGGALFLGSQSVTGVGGTITGSLFKGNSSVLDGGAIATRRFNAGDNNIYKPMLDIVNTVFDGNTAGTSGGAINNFLYHSNKFSNQDKDYVYISGSEFKNNEATLGAAIMNNGKGFIEYVKKLTNQGDAGTNQRGKIYIENTSFTDNIASDKGGAIYNDVEAVLVLDNVTFSGNKVGNTLNDIYNAGDLTLNNVKLDGGVENADGGTITVGKGTRVLVDEVDGEKANLTGVYATDLWTMAGGTLVTKEITTGDGAAVAGADMFTMASGVVEYGADYTLNDAGNWKTVVGNIGGENSNKFSLKLTGNLKEGKTATLQQVENLGVATPTLDVVATPDEVTKEVTITKDLEVASLDIQDTKKLVIQPEDNKEIEVVINKGLIRKNAETQKLDMDLKEGADVKIISEETLELGILQALNNDKLTVTLQGNFKADEFKVQETGMDNQVITFVVGGADSEKPSSLVLKDAKDTDKLQVFVDPFIAKDIGEASSYSQGGTDVKAEIIGGRNSLIVLGETDRTKAEEVFNAMQAQLKFGNAGNVNAVLYVAKAQEMAATGKLYLDGSLTDKAGATNEAQFYAAAKSLTMIPGNICKDGTGTGTGTAAISGLTGAQVDDGAKLYIEGAEVGTYKVLGAATGTTTAATIDGWVAEDVLANSLVKVDTDPSAVPANDGFYVTFKQADVDLSDTVAPNVGKEMAEAKAGSPAREAMKEMLSDLYTEDQKADNVNAYANLGENLGVSRGAYDVANMVGNAVTEHWDNNAKGENIWAVYTRNKTEVDGMKLGGMDAQYDAHYNGVVVGADLGKGFGIAVNYADGNVSNYLGGHNDSEYYGASLYGRKVWGNFSLNMDAGYTYGKNELAQNGIEADAKTDTISAGLTAKYLAKAGKYDKIGLFAGARYLHIDGRDYTDSLGVNREADKINSVVVPVGLEYTGEFKMAKSAWTFKPVLAVGYLFNLGDRENDMTMRYGGAEDIFGYDFVDKGAFFTHAGMDFEKKNFTLGISYDFMKSKNSKNNRWNVNANLAF